MAKKHEDICERLKGLDEFKYVPIEDDDVDQYLGNYMNGTGIDMEMIRLQEGLYQVGSKEVKFVMLHAGLHQMSANGKR